MGLWSWLFGRGNKVDLDELEPDGNRLIDVGERDGKRHGPYKRYRRDGTLLEEGTFDDGEKHGPFTILGRDVRIEGAYRAGKLHGLHRILNPDGSVAEEREYVDGEVVRGPHERRDEIHTHWIRERGTMVRGRPDGLWEEFGIPQDGKAPLLKRCFYRDGVLDGRYETWLYGGERDVEGEYRDNKRVGRWTHWRHDVTRAAELDYDDGALVRWRWLTWDGKERPLVTVTGDDDIARWLALGDAWDRIDERGIYGVEMAVDSWPAEERARPLAWIDERIANGERPKRWFAGSEWIEAMTDRDEIDPRTRYVDAIAVDHYDWDEDQTQRLQRFAPQVLELDLVECSAIPDITALFDVPWPKLESIMLHECGPIDAAIPKLYASPIEHVAFTYEALSAKAIAKLVEAPWFVGLQSLRLTVDDRAIVDAIAKLGMPELRELELQCYSLALSPADVVALIDREHRPTLATLALRDITVVGDLPSRDGVEITR